MTDPEMETEKFQAEIIFLSLAGWIIIIALFFFIVTGCSIISPVRYKQHIYSFQVESAGYSDIQSLYTIDSSKIKEPFFSRVNIQTLQLKINCDIKRTTLAQNKEGMLVCYQLFNPSVTLESNNLPVNAAVFNEELTHPAFVQLSEDGRINNVRTDTAITDMSANLLKEIISRMQLVIPDRSLTTWQTTEDNTTGTFKAQYKLLNKNNKNFEYEKTILEYLKLKSTLKSQKVIADSKTNFSTDSAGIVNRISVSEAQVVLFNKDTISALGNKVSAMLKSVEKIGENDLAVLEMLERSSNYSVLSMLNSPLSEDRINQLSYKKTLGSDNWETLIRRLKTIVMYDGELEDSLMLKFRALAYLNEADCYNISSALKTETYGSSIFRVLSRALTITDKECATDGLADLISKKRAEEKVVMELLPIMATTLFPTDKAVNIVKELAFNSSNNPVIVSTAQLALGGLANNFRKKNPGKSEEIVHFIIEKIQNYPDTLQQVLVFGNTGSLTIFPCLKSYIEGSKISNEVRVAAISATRLINHADVSAFLRQLLGNKDSIIVKTTKEIIAFKKEYFESNQ